MVEHVELEHVGQPLGVLEDAGVGEVPVPVELAQLVLGVELADREQLAGEARVGREGEVVDVDGHVGQVGVGAAVEEQQGVLRGAVEVDVEGGEAERRVRAEAARRRPASSRAIGPKWISALAGSIASSASRSIGNQPSL